MSKLILYLDLRKVNVYGFQESFYDLKVEAILRGIEAGDDFPPVIVKQRNEFEYELVSFWDYEDEDNYGGHHRAVAHYIANTPLKCQLGDGKYDDEENLETKTNIGDIIMADDRGQYEHAKKWRNKSKRWR